MSRLMIFVSMLMAALFMTHPAHADDDEHRATRSAVLPKYQQECSACHVAYPAGMLPVASWQHLMGNLPHHFGTDASLDPDSLKQISAWLNAHAASSARMGGRPEQDRITRSAWFIREHREISSATWSKPSIKRASNCAACHSQAEKGDFDEDRVRIPR